MSLHYDGKRIAALLQLLPTVAIIQQLGGGKLELQLCTQQLYPVLGWPPMLLFIRQDHERRNRFVEAIENAEMINVDPRFKIRLALSLYFDVKQDPKLL